MEQCGMQQDAYLGRLVDEVQGGQYRVRSQPEQRVAADEVTLSEILHRGHKPRLKRAQRFQIALKVALDSLGEKAMGKLGREVPTDQFSWIKHSSGSSVRVCEFWDSACRNTSA
jgi:hypothetical protein